MWSDTYLYSEELPAEEVLRLRVFLLRLARLRLETSPPSQVGQQYDAASTRTSSPPSISNSQAASKLTRHNKHQQAGLYYRLITNTCQCSYKYKHPWCNLVYMEGCFTQKHPMNIRHSLSKRHTHTIHQVAHISVNFQILASLYTLFQFHRSPNYKAVTMTMKTTNIAIQTLTV